MKSHKIRAARYAGRPRRALVALMLAAGAAPAFALAPLSSTFDAASDRAATQQPKGATTAAGIAPRNPTVSREPAVADGDRMAAMLLKGPAGRVDWWTGFRDSTLNLLEQMARSRPPGSARDNGGRAGAAVDTTASSQRSADAGDSAASLASAYAQARVLRIRLATAQAVVLTTRRQAELSLAQAGNTGGQGTAAGQRAAALVERAQNAAASFEATLEQRVSEIAALSGMDSAQARTVLEPSLSLSQLPAFNAVVPARLPAYVLRGRADVRSLEVTLLRERRSVGQYRVAAFAAELDGWIEPNGDTTVDAARPDVVARAKAEVGTALYRLIRQQQAAAMNYQISQLRRAEFETVLQRQQLGEAAADEVLEKHLLVLLENDRLAAAVGAVADSWIALNAATGGLATIAVGGQAAQSQSASSPQTP